MMIRRIGATVGGLLMTAAAVALLASPAQAGGKAPEVTFDDTCAGVTLTIDNHTYRKQLVRVTAGEFQPDPFWVGEQHVLDWPAEHGADIEVSYKSLHGWKSIDSHEWTNPGWPGGGCTGPEVTVVGDCTGAAVVTISAGDTRRTWKVGDAEQWADFGEVVEFDTASVDAEVLWRHNGEWVPADDDYVTRTPVDPADCATPSPTPAPTTPEPGQAGGAADEPELPLTGGGTTALTGTALGLLAAGGGALWLGGRRRAATTT